MRQPWERDGEQMLCVVHTERFRLPQVCPQCLQNPAPALQLDDPEVLVTPKGCLSQLEIERAAVSIAQETAGFVATLLGKGKGKKRGRTRISARELKDLQDVRLKALRLAGEKAGRREDDELTDRRLRTLALMRGRGPSH